MKKVEPVVVDVVVMPLEHYAQVIAQCMTGEDIVHGGAGRFVYFEEDHVMVWLMSRGECEAVCV